MRFKRFLLLTPLTALTLSSCAMNIFDLFSQTDPEEGAYGYVEQTTTFAKSSLPSITYKNLQMANTISGGACNAIPSTGDINLLVVPIEFRGYPFTSKTLSDLNRCFNGNGSIETGYWESLSSFYKKSSFNKLNLVAEITPVYSLSSTPTTFLPASSDDSSKISSLVKEVSDWYKTNNPGEIEKFDNDKDGFIDGIYLIYSCPDYNTAEKNGIQLNSNYWAFVSWLPKQKSSISSPNPNNFMWASYDFMYTGLPEEMVLSSIDAHTFIHETGHMLGFDDYYNYDADPNNDEYTDTNYKYYTPTGGLDMMDYNILDHNCWSKFALGWVNPYVIDSTTSLPLTIEINDSQSSGDFILIKDKRTKYNNSAFDEYMMVELYTPTGLNYLDSHQRYEGTYPLGFTVPGVKITHIDARVGEFHKVGLDFSGDYVDYLTLDLLGKASSTTSFNILASNTPSYSSSNQGYRLIHLMESNGKNTFQNKDYEEDNKYYLANDKTLFVGSSGRGFFTMKKFSSFFENKTKFNNGYSFPYSIKVNGIKETESGAKASITIAEV